MYFNYSEGSDSLLYYANQISSEIEPKGYSHAKQRCQVGSSYVR